MNLTALLTHLVLGLALGVVLARLHAAASRRAASSAVDEGRVARVLAGFPIRVGLPAAGMFGLALVSGWALLGAMLGFAFGQLWALRSSP